MPPMRRDDLHAAETLDSVAKAIGEWTLALMSERDPSFAARLEGDARRLWRGELKNRLDHLAEAVACRCPELLARNVQWSREAFESRGLPLEDLRASLEAMRTVLLEQLPAPIAKTAAELVDAGLARLHAPAAGRADRAANERQEPLAGDDPDVIAARLYLLHMLDREQEKAAEIVLDLQSRGRGTVEIYEKVLAPALAEVGRMWHLREASVADEHFSTAGTRLVMAELRQHAHREAPCGRSVLCTAVGGDLHDLGIRMVADVFEFAGWHAECLGADMPAEEVAVALESRVTGRFDLLAVAANTTLGLRPMARLVETVRRSRAGKGIKILVGGLPFRLAPELAEAVGADGVARTASEAVRLADRLLAASPAASPRS